MESLINWRTPEDAWKSALLLKTFAFEGALYEHVLQVEDDMLRDKISQYVDHSESAVSEGDLMNTGRHYENTARMLHELLQALKEDGRAEKEPEATCHVMDEFKRCRDLASEIFGIINTAKISSESSKQATLSALDKLLNDDDRENDVDVAAADQNELPVPPTASDRQPNDGLLHQGEGVSTMLTKDDLVGEIIDAEALEKHVGYSGEHIKRIAREIVPADAKPTLKDNPREFDNIIFKEGKRFAIVEWSPGGH